MAFLNKANADPKAGSHHDSSHASTSEQKSKFDPSSTAPPVSNDSLPASLQSIPADLTYTSDTDSPFEPVSLNYASDSLPGVDEFTDSLGAKAPRQGDVEELSVQDFDPRGQYKEIIERVEKAGSGKGVKIFRIELGTTRVAYYIVTVGDRKLVGVSTTAVES